MTHPHAAGRPQRLLCFALVLAAATACAGPRQPVDLTVKEYPGDVLLGEAPPPAAAPQPSGALAGNLEPVGFPSFIQAPVALPPRIGRQVADAPSVRPTGAAPASTAPASPCPTADVRVAPAHEASRTLTLPPAAGDITFRNNGTYKISENGVVRTGEYPTETVRTVVPGVLEEDGSFAFDVKQSVGGDVTTTSYLVDPAAALYLTGVVTQRADGGTDSFVPRDPRSLPLLPLPAKPGTDFTGNGVDPLSQTTMTTQGTVVDKVRVDACGVPLDAWAVHVDGRIFAPNKQLHFTAQYAIGTQYGGISLQEDIQVQCPAGMSVPCDNGRAVETDNVATVNTEPALARPPA